MRTDTADGAGSRHMKTLNIGIAPYAAMKARTMAIARGEAKPPPGAPYGTIRLEVVTGGGW